MLREFTANYYTIWICFFERNEHFILSISRWVYRLRTESRVNCSYDSHVFDLHVHKSAIGFEKKEETKKKQRRHQRMCCTRCVMLCMLAPAFVRLARVRV